MVVEVLQHIVYTRGFAENHGGKLVSLSRVPKTRDGAGVSMMASRGHSSTLIVTSRSSLCKHQQARILHIDFEHCERVNGVRLWRRRRWFPSCRAQASRDLVLIEFH